MCSGLDNTLHNPTFVYFSSLLPQYNPPVYTWRSWTSEDSPHGTWPVGGKAWIWIQIYTFWNLWNFYYTWFPAPNLWQLVMGTERGRFIKRNRNVRENQVRLHDDRFWFACVVCKIFKVMERYRRSWRYWLELGSKIPLATDLWAFQTNRCGTLGLKDVAKLESAGQRSQLRCLQWLGRSHAWVRGQMWDVTDWQEVFVRMIFILPRNCHFG